MLNAMARHRMPQEDFILKIKSIHGDKYDLSKTNIDKQDEKHRVDIICKEHGIFKINLYNLLNGEGCSKCAAIKRGLNKRITNEECLKRCKNIHGDLYEYNLSTYHSSHDKIIFFCKEHGWQEQSAIKHWSGQGCYYCANRCYNKETFIKESKNIFNDRFDYSLVEYNNAKEPVELICNKCKKVFSVTPNSHLCKQTGCPYCNISHLEQEIYNILQKNNIKFIWQYSDDNFGRLHLDFYLPNYNIAIECQGRQHFTPYIFFGGEETFKATRERDIRKQNICKEQNINLIYFSHEKEETFFK